MPSPTLVLDHIAVAARTLEDGVAHVRDCLGIEMPAGGAHPKMGTHNCLLSLGPDLFLEVIAVDPSAPTPSHPRWFNLDHFDEDPRLAVWVVGTSDLRASLHNAHPDCGVATEITRGSLTWEISIPKDGSLPLDGAFPSLIQWPSGPHPAHRMTDLGCRLSAFTVQHPDADHIAARLSGPFEDPRVSYQTGDFALRALIETPHGLKSLT